MKKRILIVDDERWFTNLVEYSLETEGYFDVRQENDATKAVQTARDFGPDLVILDIMMPVLDGTELAERFRADPVLCEVPVIFVTALVTDSDAPDGVCKRGGQMFLPKNVATETLIDCIEEKLRERSPQANGALLASGGGLRIGA
jgi:DNA-binding response OmpR family regulator